MSTHDPGTPIRCEMTKWGDRPHWELDGTFLGSDEHGDWVAVLSCGHTQHVRHRPPWQNRPWVLDPEQRQARLGSPFGCGWCAGERSHDEFKEI